MSPRQQHRHRYVYIYIYIYIIHIYKSTARLGWRRLHEVIAHALVTLFTAQRDGIPVLQVLCHSCCCC